MKSLFNYKLPITLVAFAAFATTANADVRYKDRMFTVETTKDVVYAEDVPALSSPHNLSSMAASFGNQIYFFNDEITTTPVNLKMDIYSPKNDADKKRAAVIVAHGGSFVAGAKDDNQKSVTYCDSLAARGFVAVSIEYRLGVTVQNKGAEIPTNVTALATDLLLNDSKYEMTIDAADYARAVYRGVQDINAAVRYIRKNAGSLGVDPDRIYVLGNSAGAILSIENVYTSKKTDFPDYSYQEEKDVKDAVIRPALGDLNDYGEEGFDSHANGTVALWGATHDPAVLKYNKTPIFLAHGDADETVLFKEGQPMSNFSVSSLLPSNLSEMLKIAIAPYVSGLKYVLSSSHPEFATMSDEEALAQIVTLLEYRIKNNITLEINAPTLYGSYVIDTALTAHNGTKAKPETYFVEGAKHEFYNKSAYTDGVSEEDRKKYAEGVPTRVFDFLYKLATSDKVLHALAGVTIARANDNPDSVYAVIDGSYDGTDVVNIPSDINVASVSFNREFTPLRYSTMTLPFSVETDNVNGLEAVLRYNGIGKDKNGNDAVKMKVVWATGDWVIANDIRNAQNQLMEYGPTDLKANTPYLVQMNAKTFSVNSGINDPITLKETPTTETDVSADGWSFRGTWQYKKWKEGDPELGNAYGYAASPSDKIKVGDFVRVGEGAWITPMRAYLVKDNLQGVRANGAYAIRSSELPEIMSVIVDNDDANEEHTTVIGHFNTRTGEFRMNNAGARTYDLKGRYVGDKANKARGAYYGKKFLK